MFHGVNIWTWVKGTIQKVDFCTKTSKSLPGINFYNYRLLSVCNQMYRQCNCYWCRIWNERVQIPAKTFAFIFLEMHIPSPSSYGIHNGINWSLQPWLGIILREGKSSELWRRHRENTPLFFPKRHDHSRIKIPNKINLYRALITYVLKKSRTHNFVIDEV